MKVKSETTTAQFLCPTADSSTMWCTFHGEYYSKDLHLCDLSLLYMETLSSVIIF